MAGDRPSSERSINNVRQLTETLYPQFEAILRLQTCFVVLALLQDTIPVYPNAADAHRLCRRMVMVQALCYMA